MSQRDEHIYVKHMVDNCNKAISFIKDISREDFDRDEKLRLALTHLLQIIGEAARRVSPEFRANHQVDVITRNGIENSRNYLRRQEILSSAKVIYDKRHSVFA